MEDGKAVIKVVYEDNHLLIVNKPSNIPVQADRSTDKDLLTMLKELLKEKYQKPGNVYLGLIHRLDRPVDGIMVFAKTSKAASRLSEQIRNNTFKKTYLAVVQGRVPSKGVLKDKLTKDRKNNITRISSTGKYSELDYELLKYKENLSLIKINLKTGRSHQIRVQFSSRNHPLYGDQKYNPNTPKDQIALFAYQIEFIHPTTKQLVRFSLPKPNRYPFNIFKWN